MTTPSTPAEARSTLQAMLPELRRRWPISYLGVFGSWSRDEQRADSDLDLLVDFDGPIDLYGYVELQDEIGQRLGLPVDLVHRPGRKRFIGRQVLAEVHAL